jgi:hypothetical protein
MECIYRSILGCILKNVLATPCGIVMSLVSGSAVKRPSREKKAPMNHKAQEIAPTQMKIDVED